MTHSHRDAHEGLEHDLETLWNRRRLLGLLTGVGAAGFLAACGTSGATNSAPTASPTAAADCATEIPAETAGPYPGDGSNGPNVLTESGIVRRDITPSFGSSTGQAEGVALRIEMALQDTSCMPLAGAAVYVWHCSRAGDYSLYSAAAANENYLRGVQAADKDGLVVFDTVFPGCYAGRWPHVHFEVYASVDEATAAGQIVATSQIALPGDTCDVVYAETGYEASPGNLAQLSLQSDMVFGDDGAVHQLASISGSVATGYVARLTVAV